MIAPAAAPATPPRAFVYGEDRRSPGVRALTSQEDLTDADVANLKDVLMARLQHAVKVVRRIPDKVDAKDRRDSLAAAYRELRRIIGDFDWVHYSGDAVRCEGLTPKPVTDAYVLLVGAAAAAYLSLRPPVEDWSDSEVQWAMKALPEVALRRLRAAWAESEVAA